jgi:hypothetical protein
MGTFELMDLTGLDVSGKVMQSIFDQFQHEPRYRPSSLTPHASQPASSAAKPAPASTNMKTPVSSNQTNPPRQKSQAPSPPSSSPPNAVTN